MVTPFEHYPALAKALGLKDIALKREDLHPYKSHKGRSIPVMIDYYYGKGDRSFAISSSGNAALAAALHVRKLNETEAEQMISGKINLDIFIGRNAASHKAEALKSLANENIRVLVKERPLQALSEVTDNGVRSLRQSTDDVALIGYKTLAEEIAEIPHVGAVFVGASSGTTAQELARYFSSTKIGKSPAKHVQVHIVQTSACHPLVDGFQTFEGSEEKSLADAIVDKTALRKPTLIPLIQKTGGHGWFASNESIENALEMVSKHANNLELSANGVLGVVGAMQAAYQGWEIDGTVVCVVGGM